MNLYMHLVENCVHLCIMSRRDCVGLVVSRGGQGLTNCESYDTLALLTRTEDLYETLNTSPGGVYKVLNTPDTECFPQYNT